MMSDSTKTTERGYTLAELLVAMAVLVLLLGGLFVTLQSGQTAYLFGAGRVEVQQNARVGLERMLRELRTATQVATANAHDITFQFLDSSSTLVTVAYSLSGTNLQRNQTIPTPVATQPEILVGGVQSLSFSYFDANNLPLSSPVTAASVYGVGISLTTQTEDSTLASYSPANRQAVVAGRVKLRNE